MATDIETSSRLHRALELRTAGASNREIARELAISPSYAGQLVKRALAEHEAEAVHDLRLIDGARLEQLLHAIWEKGLNGDLRAIDRILLIMERKAKLFGLDQSEEINMLEVKVHLFRVIKDVLPAEYYQKVIEAAADQ